MGGIKNPHIIHYLVGGTNHLRYLCNGVCGTTRKKSTFLEKKVTCKSCLKRLVQNGRT